jgi:acid phosphatase family membrane protein YuiD
MKLMVELITSKQVIPTKSCQSGGLPSPFANAIAMIAAASITHDRGFHMNPKNLRNLLSCSLKYLSLVYKSANNIT